MRKFTALAALSVFALPLAACGGETATDEATEEAPAMEEAAPAPEAAATQEGAMEDDAPAEEGEDRGMNPIDRAPQD